MIWVKLCLNSKQYTSAKWQKLKFNTCHNSVWKKLPINQYYFWSKNGDNLPTIIDSLYLRDRWSVKNFVKVGNLDICYFFRYKIQCNTIQLSVLVTPQALHTSLLLVCDWIGTINVIYGVVSMMWLSLNRTFIKDNIFICVISLFDLCARAQNIYIMWFSKSFPSRASLWMVESVVTSRTVRYMLSGPEFSAQEFYLIFRKRNRAFVP